MPPQQTNLTSETGRDAAGLGLDLSIALVKDAMGEALAAARPDASIVALRDTLSEKDAAGPPAASTRSVLSLLKGYWRAFQERRQRQRLRATAFSVDMGLLGDAISTGNAVDSTVDACPCRRTGFHFAGTCFSLHDLSDRELMDIGVTRAEIDRIAGHRAIDRLRDGTTHLWILSRGVM
jgi:uncharacterized protein DUF1127